MADFTFAILVPLASPIQPVATLNMTRKTRHRVHLTPLTSSEPAAFGIFKMILVELGVNSSMEEYATPLV